VAIVFLTESMFGMPTPPTVRPLEPSGFVVKRVRGVSAARADGVRAATSVLLVCCASGAATGSAAAGAAARVLSRAVTRPATSTEGRICGTSYLQAG